MSRIPLIGSQQPDARLDGTPPRVRTRSWWALRASDGQLASLNEGMSVAYRGRSGAATIYASDGSSGLLAASAPAFSAIDWDGDGVREEDGLILSDEEALRYTDPNTGGLLWRVTPLVIRLDGIGGDTAVTDGAPFWSFTTDDVSGAYLAVLGVDGGGIAFVHHNGDETVSSAMPLSATDRFSLRANLMVDGSVQAAVVRNGGREVVGARSDALALAPAWGDGGATKVRLNELGNTLRGAWTFRYGAVYGGNATRARLLEVL